LFAFFEEQESITPLHYSHVQRSIFLTHL